MEPLRRSKIGCCWGCKSRSVEPNCHSYCPTYLAEKLDLEAEKAQQRKEQAVELGIRDQRNSSYLRNARDYERCRKRKRKRQR